MPAIIDYANGSGFIKTSDVSVSVIGNVATYILGFVNTGDEDANNVIVYDTIPTGVTFIENSIKINGLPIYGSNLSTGVPLGNIKPWSGPSLEYSVIINTSDEIVAKEATVIFDNGSGSSNEFVIDSLDSQMPLLILEKESNKSCATIGDTITYSITATNDIDIELIDVVIKDELSPNLVFVAGSVKVNNVPSFENIITGIHLGVLSPSVPNIITFDANVISDSLNGNIVNQAQGQFSYIIDDYAIPGFSLSNIVTIPATCLIPSLEIKKESCVCTAHLGESIPYTIKIRNTSTTIVSNIIVEDILPSGVYVSSANVSEGSFTEVNGILKWTIPSLAQQDTAVAMVIVIPTDKVCFDNQGFIINTAKITSYNGLSNINNISDTVMTKIDCFCSEK